MKVWGVVGWKNSGKTGLVERLVSEFVQRGLAVSTLKHAHHAFEIDQEGRDSYRHRAAGATEVLLSGGRRWALMHELRRENEPRMEELLRRMAPVDLVLVEGYKRERHAKIEAHRAATGQPLIADRDDTVRAVASDSGTGAPGRPVFDLDDTRAIADFISRELGL